MYFPYFVTYIMVGIVITAAAFWWALRNRQFADQQRARYLPLEADRDTSPAPKTRAGRYEIYTLFFLAFAGLAASAAVLVFALIADIRLH